MISPPRPIMPALNALRAFEAAARHQSFTEAASELSVTPGAVAQHIKALEDWTGKKLFNRLPQGVELTALGAGVLADFTLAFDHLGEAVHKLRNNAAPQEIRIAALPSVAQLWLSPRLPKLREELPQLSVSVSALEERPLLKRDPYDVTVFFDSEPLKKGRILIGQESILPVCSRTIAKQITCLEDLAKFEQLRDTAWAEDWNIWLDANWPDRQAFVRGPSYSLYALALEEAKNGAGILMGHKLLVDRYLKSGELVAPLESEVSLDYFLTLEIADHQKSNPFIQQLISYLVPE